MILRLKSRPSIGFPQSLQIPEPASKMHTPTLRREIDDTFRLETLSSSMRLIELRSEALP
jgi:hypothetical protein